MTLSLNTVGMSETSSNCSGRADALLLRVRAAVHHVLRHADDRRLLRLPLVHPPPHHHARRIHHPRRLHERRGPPDQEARQQVQVSRPPPPVIWHGRHFHHQVSC